MIELKNLTKKFDTFTAVDYLNLKIETGEFFGLLGPNGAGKTTTISLMSTLLLPTEGEILIDGELLSRKNPGLKRKISVIRRSFFWMNRRQVWTPFPDVRCGTCCVSSMTAI